MQKASQLISREGAERRILVSHKEACQSANGWLAATTPKLDLFSFPPLEVERILSPLSAQALRELAQGLTPRMQSIQRWWPSSQNMVYRLLYTVRL
jgi:hypothetical protein